MLPLGVALMIIAALWWSRTTVQSEPATYVALGASDAVGVGADDPSRQGWVPLVHTTLPPGTRLLNLGISGATIADILRAELPPALDAKPRWITLWPGVNDLRRGVALTAFSADLEQVLQQIDAARIEPAPQIILLTIPDLRHLAAFSRNQAPDLDATVHQWNAAIVAAAKRHGAHVIDLYAHGPDLATHPEYISGDGFHPSSSGYRRIADLVSAALHSGDNSAS